MRTDFRIPKWPLLTVFPATKKREGLPSRLLELLSAAVRHRRRLQALREDRHQLLVRDFVPPAHLKVVSLLQLLLQLGLLFGMLRVAVLLPRLTLRAALSIVRFLCDLQAFRLGDVASMGRMLGRNGAAENQQHG